MARIRTIKPEFWLHEGLATLPFECRLLFIGLWNLADREGRLQDRPQRIHMAIFPYDRGLDMNAMLERLAALPERFIVRYEVEGGRYLWIPTFKEHQCVNHREATSSLPPDPKARARPGSTGQARARPGGREGN